MNRHLIRASAAMALLAACGTGNPPTATDDDAGSRKDIGTSNTDLGDAGAPPIDMGPPPEVGVPPCSEIESCGGVCRDLQRDIHHCGGCNNACPAAGANAMAVCEAGVCREPCNAGYSPCGGGAPTCVNLQSDPAHCGACGNACPAGQACRSGACICTNTAQELCDDVCVDRATFQTSATNCGRCGNACATSVAGATAACVAGACTVRCGAGQRLTGGACVTISTPRAVGPITPFVVSSLRPTLRWDLGTGNDGVRVEICDNRNCAGTPVQSFDVRGSSGRVPTALMPRRTYWWRLYGRAGEATGTTPSTTWMLQAPARDLGTDTTLAPTRRDINGDGYDDLAVGSLNSHVEVLFGSADGLRTGASDRLTFDDTEAGFGYALGLGDVNADGLADLVVASSLNVHVFHGSATAPYLPRSPSTTLSIAATAGRVGSGIAVGDIDSDGDDDVVAGAWDTRVIVVMGSSAGLDPASVAPISTRLSPAEGAVPHFVSDLDGNGHSEVVIASSCHPLSGRCGDTSGQAWLFAGTRTGLATTTVTPAGLGTSLPLNQGSFGQDVAGNDWDGDGYGDIYVASARVGARLFRGRATLPPPQSSAISGDYRFALASGDFDLDGTVDLAVASGATIDDLSVEIYRAGTGTSTRRLTGTDGGSYGIHLSSSDYNGDGVPDLVASALYAFSHRGRVYVHSGARGTGVAIGASQVIDPVGTNVTYFGYLP